MKYFAIGFLLLFFVIPYQGNAQQNEVFDPSLKRLNSLELLNKYIDSLMLVNDVTCDSKDEVQLVNDVIQNRFYHGYCHYSPEENLLAYLAGEYVWEHLSAIVMTEDILKYEYAACSQQAIVMMKTLKARGFKVRKLGLVGHFVLEVFYENTWHYYDPNKEPLIQGLEHDSLEMLVKNGIMAQAYSNNLSPEAVNKMFSKIVIGETNEYPAKNARLFHQVTKFISTNFLFILCGFIGFVIFYWNRILNRKRLGKGHFQKSHKKVLV